MPSALQVVEQHSLPAVQFSPPPLQEGATGAAHVPLSQRPEQHSLRAEQRSPPGRHWPLGSTHTFEAQEPLQQSAVEPHSSPIALHCDGCTQVPLQASEQHS